MSPKNHPSGASAGLATAALTLALLGAPGPAPAVDRLRLTPQIGVEEEYDSNVFNDDNREEGGLVTHVRPGLFLAHRGDLGDVAASAEFDTYLGSEASDGINRLLRLSGNRNLTQRLAVNLSAGYSYFEDTSSENFAPSDPSQPVPTSQDASFERLATSAGLSYSLGPRTALAFGADQVKNEFTDSGTSNGDSSIRSGRASLIRQLSMRDSLSFTASLAESDFARSESIAANDTSRFTNTVSWDRSWTATFSTSLIGGFSQVETSADTSVTLEADPLETVPPGLPPGTVILPDEPVPDTSAASSSTAFNGGLSLTWLLPRGLFQLDLGRATSARGGLSSEVNTDSISARFERRLASRWSLSSDLGYSRVKSASETPVFFPDFYIFGVITSTGQPAVLPCGTYARVTAGGRTGCVGLSDNAIDFKTTWANLSLHRQMTKRMRSAVTYSYTQQSSTGDTDQADYDEHRVSVGLRYTYDIDLL